MPTRKQFLTAAGVAMLATLLVVPVASAATNNSVPEMLREILTQVNYVLGNMTTSINNGNSDLEMKLWSADDSVKNDTKQIQTIIDDIGAMNETINAKLDLLEPQASEAPQVLTVSGRLVIPNQTTVPDGEDHLTITLARVHITDGAAANYKLAVYFWIDDPSNDISEEIYDNFQVVRGIGEPSIYFFPIYKADGEIGDGLHEAEFVGTSMTMYIILHGTVQEDIEVYYSYTVTTSANVVIDNQNPDLPAP